MDLFTREDLRALLSERKSSCLSLFIPTRRGGGEGDPIRWRKALTAAEDALVQHGWRPATAREFLTPAQNLLHDPVFWKRTSDGLAFFLSEDFQRHFRLPLAFDERVSVGRHFLITPLLPLLTGGKFFILALSHNNVRLFQATRDTISPVELPGVPHNLKEAVAQHEREDAPTFRTWPAVGGAGSSVAYHGHGVELDVRKENLRRYFQQVDHGLRGVLRQERAPLVLAAVDYLQPIFRQTCSYPSLMPEGLEGNPDRLSDQELHRRAWNLVAPYFQQPREKALALFQQLHGTGRTATSVEQVLPAALRGEIEILFVAQDQLESNSRSDESSLNTACIHTLRHGGRVYTVPAEQLPNGERVAAIFWLPFARHAKGR